MNFMFFVCFIRLYQGGCVNIAFYEFNIVVGPDSLLFTFSFARFIKY